MLFTSSERAFAQAIRRLAYANPFDRELQAAIRTELAALPFDHQQAAQRLPAVAGATDDSFPDQTTRRIEALLEQTPLRIQAGALVSDADRTLVEDLVITALFLRYFTPHLPPQAIARGEVEVERYRAFRDAARRFRELPHRLEGFLDRPEHAFAVFQQYRVAEYLLWTLLQGDSRPLARLRAAAWRSILPREQRWYGVLLYQRMHEVTTLILGPSGTGKELVATAIGLARYVAFDPRRERFVEPYCDGFHAVNLSAMSPGLIESELFGHVAGAFTGALHDREGWFEKCRAGHTVFLDELGELNEPLQVRLLRVLQSRDFYRVGDTQPRRFAGRVIAATNRDLGRMIAAGQFRSDLYFRICSDVIHTPSLREQLDDSPQELPRLVRQVAHRCLGEAAPTEFVEELSRTALAWIEQSPALGWAYPWPGNYRELEQCVRSVMVRGEYTPPIIPAHTSDHAADAARPPTGSTPEPLALDQFLAAVRAGRLEFDELLTRYCSLVQSRTNNLAETARRLKKHRLTVQGRIDPAWVARFRES